MALRHAQARLAQVWQLPWFLVSLGLFGYAAYLLIDPKPGPTFAQRIDSAEVNAKAGRFDEALAQCNKLLTASQIKAPDEARLHLLVAAIIEGAQKEHHLNVPTNYQRIIEQTQEGLDLGGVATADTYRRLGDSQKALGNLPQAIKAYRKAISADPAGTVPLVRKVIELELTQEDAAGAENSIANYLKLPNLSKADRAWALDKQAQALAKRGQYAGARKLLEEARTLDATPVVQGTVHYWLGYCFWKMGDHKEAERVLRVARDQLTIVDPLDANAAYLLGEIRQAENDPKEAISFYRVVLTSHPESTPAPLARLNRGVCRIMLDDDPAGLADMHEVVGNLSGRKLPESQKSQLVDALRQASALLGNKSNLQGAIEALADEQVMVPEPPADFYARLAGVLERRADQIEQQGDAALPVPAEDNSRRPEQARKVRVEAGDAYIALSEALTIADDRGQGEAMWKGVDLYDHAGATQKSISALETFIAERPSDGKTPDALLRLGRAYQSIGQFDRAIKDFQQNQFRYGQSLAASRSLVPLAQAYVAKGPDFYGKAEKTLLAVLENNQVLTPESEEFRQALFELAQLQYRTGRYEEAISRLEESTLRYPRDERMSQLLFLMADSYRKSARLLNATISPPADGAGATTRPATPVELAAAASARAEALVARHDRLLKAKSLFDRVVDLAHTVEPKNDLDRLYLKLSNFYRADCLYDLGEYEEAIRLYDAATLRYQDDPTAVSGYVQIVNAYCAMGRLDDARTANERAKWLLKRMPPEAFEAAQLSMPKEYWDNWLKWTSESGVYAKDLNKGSVSDAR